MTAADVLITPDTEVDNVKVVVRCRPLTNGESQDGHVSAVQVDRTLKSISLFNIANRNEPPKTYTFDEVFDHASDQITIYNAVARPIVENILRGYNGTIFAYGQTGTGKTYTMSGDDDVPEQRGIIPNTFAHIFDHIAKCRNEKTFLVRVSYLEIYNEDVRDLLARSSSRAGGTASTALEVKERADVGVYVKDLSNVTVCNADDMFRLMCFGNANRQTSATSMNERSSRSHALFTVTVECSEMIGGRQHLTQGKLHLVDLAGSERQSKTNASGDRLKEASKINLSLSNLGNVISALVDPKATHIPYRNSKLTRLLQDSLGGNSKTVMIANIGPASYNYDETISTLRYANRAKSIKNVTHINEDPKDALLRKFQLEIAALRQQLENEEEQFIGEEVDLTGNGGTGNAGDPSRRAAAVDQHFRDRIAAMERDMASKRHRLVAEKGMAEAERQRIADELQSRESELAATKREHDRLTQKLTSIERKLLVGGENMLEKAEQQAQLLEQSNQELEHARHNERLMSERLASGEAERLDIEERYSSLQEEVVGRTRRLKKAWLHYTQTKAELRDVEAEHRRETEALLENIRQLQRELSFATALTDAYIPDACEQLIEANSYWSEEIGDWQLRCIAYTGNNMRSSVAGPAIDARRSAAHKSSDRQLKPTFPSYIDLLGDGARVLSTSTSTGTSQHSGPKFRPRSAMKDRNAARIKALLD